MAVIPTPTIPNIGPAPTTSDPTSFDSRADVFLGQLPAWGVAVQSVGAAAQANATEAGAQATVAGQQATAAAQQAYQAQLAVGAAQAVAGATPWVSGTYYAQYAVVISPANGQNYRRRTAGSSATDPSLDPGNWFALLLSQQYPVQFISTDTAATAGVQYIFTASCKLTLPSNPSVSDVVIFNNESGTITCRIDPNGKSIRGDSSVMTIDSITAMMTLKYSGPTFGWIKQ